MTAAMHSLVEHGPLEAREYREPSGRTRTEYRPTRMGKDLQPVLTTLMDWAIATAPARTGRPHHPLRLRGPVAQPPPVRRGHEPAARDPAGPA